MNCQSDNPLCTLNSAHSGWNRTGALKAPNPNGVTLIEVLLVLAILAALAGMAAPSFESMISSRKLNNSVDSLVNELAESRVTAMRTGQAQVFRATIGSRQYTIAPWLGGNDSINASGGAVVDNGTGSIVETDASTGAVVGDASSSSIDAKELLDGVQFHVVDTVVDTRNALEIQSEGGMVPAAGSPASAASGGLSNPIILYPDGSSTTGQIVLVDSKGRRMAIQIRGVTGQLKYFRTTSIDPGMLSSTTTP